MIVELKNKYQDKYNDLINKQVKEMIGSQRFGPTYVERFIDHYATCPPDTRKFLRSFVFTKLQECENQIRNETDSKVKEKLEKRLGLYEVLFTAITMIKTII